MDTRPRPVLGLIFRNPLLALLPLRRTIILRPSRQVIRRAVRLNTVLNPLSGGQDLLIITEDERNKKNLLKLLFTSTAATFKTTKNNLIV
jgi:hypothetical protein